MKKYLIEFTVFGSDRVETMSINAYDFDEAYSDAKDIPNLDVILTIKEL